MDTLRAKRFRAESIYLIFQNIQQRTEYSHLGLNLIETKKIGEAVLLCARRRPKFVGGSRAVYNEKLL